MRVPVSWLRDFAPFDEDVEALVANLDDLGLVVESVERVGEGLAGVKVARVAQIAPIDGADQIRRVVVEDGDGSVEVVCGAWNFEVGDLVPLATIGAVLPGGFEISRRKMRGVVSNGMLCSMKELSLGDDHGGILVLSGSALPGSGHIEPGMDLAEAIGIAPDVVLDVAVEANRPDAWCMAGIARDLAARLRLPFAIPDPGYVPMSESPAPAPIEHPQGGPEAPSSASDALTRGVGPAPHLEVLDPDLCPRFVAQIITGVSVGTSPPWIQRRLTLAGMRPVNNVVDASNYVMLELGQPTHPYDLDRLEGHGLRVRAARQGEAVVTLDGVRRQMASRSVGPGDDMRDCVICDLADQPVGIAGIMGGGTTEIDASTENVLLEAAYFAPMAVARTSKRLALRTEASARFERGCDPYGIDRAVDRIVELVRLSSPEIYAMSEARSETRGEVPLPGVIELRSARVGEVLGTPVSDSEMVSRLTAIGFGCEAAGNGVLRVTVPTFRPDTSREIDVIEEVARHLGYSRLARKRPVSPGVGRLTSFQVERRRIRGLVASMGAHEAWTSSLLAPGDHRMALLGDEQVVVANPLTPEEYVLRRSLLPGLMKALVYNEERRQGWLRLFEIGHVFPMPDASRLAAASLHEGATPIDEREVLGVLFAWPDDGVASAVAGWSVMAHALGVESFLRSKEPDGPPPGLHPTRSAWIAAPAVGSGSSGIIGSVGEVDPDVAEAFGIGATPGAVESSPRRRIGWLEVDLRLLACTERHSAKARPVSRFPSSDLDLAFVVPEEIDAADVEKVLREAGGEMLEGIHLFDVYRGKGVPPGTRSLAFRLRYCSLERTMTEADLVDLRQACVAAVERAYGVHLRGETGEPSGEQA